jgi:hypothetical protein
MKRFFCLMLALCLLGLCGCVRHPAPAETPVPAAAEDLSPILAEIRERMQPGTAGSSLTAQQLAVLLLDWSLQTGMDEAQIRAAAEAFLAPLSEEDRAAFAEQLGAVQSAAERLRGENSEALMEDIGGAEGTLWPWTDAPQDKLGAVFSSVN